MWFWFSLIAILFWSATDLFAKMGSKEDDKLSHWKMVIGVGAIMGIHALISIIGGTEFLPVDMIRYLPASALYILAMILGYVGLRYIVLSVSSPICNSSGAVAAVLCFVFLDETMTTLQLGAVCCICAGILMLSIVEKRMETKHRMELGQAAERKYTHSFIAILLPILYCVIDGAGTFADALLLDGYIGEDSAEIAYELTFLFMAVCAFIYVVLVKKEKLLVKKEWPKLVSGTFETVGQVFYIKALAANPIVAAPLISSYCLFSLLWARLILKEKLTRWQYTAIAVAAVGIVILGME